MISHRGRPGDPEVRLNLLELQFVNDAGLPLTAEQVNQLIARIDSVVFGEQEVDVATGRYPNGSDNWQRLAAPTPGRLNAGFVSVSSVQLPFVYREVGCP